MRSTLFAFLALLVLALPVAAQDTTVSHGISAFGELKYPPDFAHFDYVNPSAPRGGTMSFRGTLASQTFDSLNKFILAGEAAQGLELIYDQLMVRAWDEPDALYGLLAETIEYPADRSWVIFKLRADARFSDGMPVTADDVAWTIETLKTKANPLYRLAIEEVEGAEVLSPREVKVTFRAGAQTRDLIATVAELEVLPKHYYQANDFERSTMIPPVGSGPYVVSSADPGRRIIYCRNPQYWGASLPVNRGTNNFDCYRYEYFSDSTAAFEALKAGVYLFHEENFSALWATGYDFPSLKGGWVKRETLPDGRSSGAQGFWFNLRNPKFQDRRVREALGMMFNFEWSNETLFYGLYERTDSFWENSHLQAEGALEGEELAFLEAWRDRLPETVFSEPAFVPPVSQPNKTDRAMVRQANALLEEAGWVVGSDGVRRNEAGEVLSVEFLSNSPPFERIILPFIENLKAVGIDATLNMVDPAEYEERQERFDYDIVSGRYVLPVSPSVELNVLFGSNSANDPGSANLSGIADPVIDEIIQQVLAAEDRETLDVRVRALDRVLRDRMIWIPNWFKGEHWVAYWDVFDHPATKPPYTRGVDFWWWNEEKFRALKSAGALR